MVGADGPDKRTMPMPPRPAGVATAMMVSVVLNTESGGPDRPGCYFCEITTVFRKASPMLSDVTA